MCTLRNFPNQIEHCIEWGRDKFNELFVDGPGDVVSYLDNPGAYLAQQKADATSGGILQALERMQLVMNTKVENKFEHLVGLGIETYNIYFDHSIRDLLSIFPPDHKDREG